MRVCDFLDNFMLRRAGQSGLRLGQSIRVMRLPPTGHARSRAAPISGMASYLAENE
jgi:hypothetical protein